jgi:dimethylargininase
VSNRFSRAILRRPGKTYANGLTVTGGGQPDLARALVQHAAYERALESCGLTLTVLPADERFPDSTFVEDAAILTERAAIVTRPGAPSRLGETETIERTLDGFFRTVLRILAPSTVDGGDICQCEDRFLIGVSERTSPEGARELAGILGNLGYRSTLIDIRASKTLLHLKTGITYLGEGRLVVSGDLPAGTDLKEFEPVTVDAEESYAANSIRVNDRVLVAAGFPRFAERLAGLGYEPLPLDMSEFRKMDGGLSCLSLRF